MTSTNVMIIPEFIIHDTIEALLGQIREEFDEAVDKTTTKLFKMVSGVAFQRFDFFEQAKAIITGKEDSPRKLEVDLMFNMQRNGAPTIHITLPAEATQGNGNGLGTDEGYVDYIEDQEADPDNHVMEELTPVYSRRYIATYNVVVTTDNALEAIFLYHFTRSLLTAAIPHFSLAGLQNVKFGGQDIQPYAELANQLYMRAIQMTVEYDTGTPALNFVLLPNDINVNGTPQQEL